MIKKSILTAILIILIIGNIASTKRLYHRNDCGRYRSINSCARNSMGCMWDYSKNHCTWFWLNR